MTEEVKKKSKKGLVYLKWFGALVVLAVLGGWGVGKYVLWQGAQFDDLEVLKSHKPVLYSRIYDKKGNLIDIISSEQRIPLHFEDIPENFVHALVAVEDEYFFNHIGVSPLGILSALKDNFMRKRPRGASTLTQQLVKNITKDKRWSYKRKLKEQFLAVQLEARFTKEEIFAQYVNEVPFDNNQFGIESAARYYFGKSVGALSLVECATLAGIPQAPNRFNPYRHPEACIRKRNIVLDRMAVEGYITPDECAEAKKQPMELRDRRRVASRPVAAHFVDKVRAYLFEKYGEDQVRTSGWDIHTTLDMDYQAFAETAVREGLKGVDKQLGYRQYDCPSVFKGVENPAPDLLDTYFDPSWHMPIQDGASIRGLVMNVDKDTVTIRIKNRLFHLDNTIWITRIKDMHKYFKPGDVPLFKVVPKDEEDRDNNQADFVDEESGITLEGESDEEQTETLEGEEPKPVSEENFPFTLELDQEPDIEGAFVAVDAHSGDMLAMVGSYDYRRSKFNRAEQAQRQVGSAFKPIIFGAALEQGYTLSDTLFDEPTLFVDPTQFYYDQSGELQVRTTSPTQARKMRLGLIPKPKPYQPHNYYNRYVGAVTLRNALAQSKNIVSVKLLNSVGYDNVLEYIHRLKLNDNCLQPYPSLALGAMEMSLAEMVYTYGTFANSGVRYEPRFISLIMDSKGRVIEENPPKGEQLVSPQNAYLVTEAMKSVIFDPKGSGRRAKQLNYPHLAGKTGTTNDYADAWFVGYSPTIVAGAWVGRDLKHTIGKGRAGSNTALPIWKNFFEKIKKDLPLDPFPMPEGLIKMPVDRVTGKKITRDCDCDEKDMILETFVKGTEPTEVCSEEEKKKFSLPWYLQKRTYQYDEEIEGVRPNTVMIDYPSQRRAVKFLETLKIQDIN